MAAVSGSAPFSERSGTVTAFDDHVGAGEVTAADGSRWFFHCTSIADGSRQIDAEAQVTFVVRPGPVGLEAFQVTPMR